jgi:hypothetical protein
LNGGLAAPGKRAAETDLDEELDAAPRATSMAAFSKPVEKAPVKAPAKEVDFDNDDDSLSYFAKLAED